MKQGKSLMELAQELTRQQDSKRDFVADTKTLTVEPLQMEIEVRDSAANMPVPVSGLQMKFNGDSMPINRYALRQIGDRLKIPAKYVDRLALDHPDLLSDGINRLLSDTAEAQAMGERARRRAEKVFSPARSARGLEEVFLRVLEGRKRQ